MPVETLPMPSDPAYKAQVVVKSDTVPLPYGCRALYIGGAGDVAVVPSGHALSAPVTFVGMLAGSYLLVSCAYVMSTGTTATNIVALF
jgi:hypothetical protein